MLVKTSVVAADIASLDTDALVIGLHDVADLTGAAKAIDHATNGAIGELLTGGDFAGRVGQDAVIYPRGAIGARRVVLVGLGPLGRHGLESVRRAAARATSRAADLGAKAIALSLGSMDVPGTPPADVAQAAVEGSLLASYRFEATRRSSQQAGRIDALTLVTEDETALPDFESGTARGEVISRAVWAARDLVNQPPNVANPLFLAEHARLLAGRTGLSVHIGDKAWATEQKMGAFLAVAQGTRNEPAFIVLEHNAGRSDL
ncbi:MAG TPA: M17 family peptidase N-terminal domain-containing protein, partial [Trueperaceae bacterium]|nr:M17 family peptidase N-terminal domain-containing protein [Trueperaceae bacterium]